MNEVTTDIKSLIKSLRSEIEASVDDREKEAQLLRLQEIAATYEGEDKLISSEEIAENVAKRPPERKMHTGIKGLDAILDGFRAKQLIILSGITKHGKTSFAIDLTSRLAKENPTWLPFEEPAEELVQKFLDRNEKPPMFYAPQKMSSNALNWIEKKIVEGKAKYDTKLVFIDHLHYILPRSTDLAQEIGFTVRSLKTLAMKWNVTIVLLAHLRKVELNKNPNLDDLRDSSSIAQEADTVLLIWRKTTKNHKTGEIDIGNETNISVQANRRTGKTGNVKMIFADGKFLEEDWQQREHEEETWGEFADVKPR